MTTDGATNVVTKPRDVGTILALGTYQGCTDEEIQKVIDFKIENAVASAETKAKQAANITQMNEFVAMCKSAAEAADAALKTLTAHELKLRRVNGDGEEVS